MKKTVFLLLAAVLLMGSVSASPKNGSEPLTTAEANEILSRISGSWAVNMTLWSPDQKTYTTSHGQANISTSYLDNYTREQFAVKLPDGKAIKGESFLRYNSEKERFEVVQLDNSGSSVIMMVGQWYPEHRSLVFKQVARGEEDMQFRYVFLTDGSVSKMTHKRNKNGKFYLASVSHYGHHNTAAK